MQLTPFFGLSTFADICLILVYKIFAWKTGKPGLNKKNQPLKRLLGSFIILGMLGFIFISSMFVLDVGVKEKHSSIYFIENHMSFFNDLVDRSKSLAIINVAS